MAGLFVLSATEPDLPPPAGSWEAELGWGLIVGMGAGYALAFIVGYGGHPKWFFAPHVRDLPAPWRGEVADQRARKACRRPAVQPPGPAVRRSTGSDVCEVRVSRLPDFYFGRWGRYVVEVDGARVASIRRSESVVVPVVAGRAVRVVARSLHVFSNEWLGVLDAGERVELKLGMGAPDSVYEAVGDDYLFALYEV